MLTNGNFEYDAKILKFLILMYWFFFFFVKYKYVLNWHVHWYVCTAVWDVLISFIIVSWYWYITVFGHPSLWSCYYFCPSGLAPAIIYSVNSPFPQKMWWSCETIATEELYFSLHSGYVYNLQVSKTCIWNPLLTNWDPSVIHNRWPAADLCLHSCLGTTST